jgi:pyruvate dehydrogenase E2 component (dihydrolipoamide acetyltransferase)
MPYEIVIPKLGLTMETGRLVEWHKKNGQIVEEGEVLFTIETEKTLQEVDAQATGVVYHRPDITDGDLPIGTLIGFIADKGEKIVWPEIAVKNSDETNETIAHPESLTIAKSTKSSSEIVKVESSESGVPTGGALDSSVRISPVARRIAIDLGIDLKALSQKYPGKRLTREDVKRAAVLQDSPLSLSRTPQTPMRKLIADRMFNGAQITAPVTLTTEVDATELVQLRSKYKGDPQVVDKTAPTYIDLLIKLVAEALKEHPNLNSQLEDGYVLALSEIVNMGIAVDTERGLLVPVLFDVLSKNIFQIAEATALLIDNARSGKIAPDLLTGSTFTITNLGMYGIDAFTPIINLPECAILGIGRIVPKFVVTSLETEITAIRHMLTLSLTFDHRLVDGAPAARFLQHVKQFIEQPDLWLMKI